MVIEESDSDQEQSVNVVDNNRPINLAIQVLKPDDDIVYPDVDLVKLDKVLLKPDEDLTQQPVKE